MNAKTFRRARAAGFTLVEIMIGLLIGLIGIVVIMETYAVSEGYRRTTTSGSDAQVNGAIAMYMMQRELRIAGYNMQPYVTEGCTQVVLWENNLGKSRWVRFLPVEINPAGYNVGDINTDVLLISYGTADGFVTGIVAGQNRPNEPDNVFRTKSSGNNNRTSWRTGDLLFSAMPDASSPGGMSCVVHELTRVQNQNANCGQGAPPDPNNPSAPAPPNLLEHANRQYPNFSFGCQLVQANHNAPGGILDPNNRPVPALDASGQSQVFSMGATPVARIYAIRSGNLTVCDSFTKDCTNPNNYDVLVNDIVSMRALLGGATSGANTGAGMLGGGTVDQWSRNALVTQYDARRTQAVAIELTARSGLKEKSSTGSPDPTQCDATKNSWQPDMGQTTDWYASYLPMAAGSLAGAKIDLSQTDAQGQWKCYRYKMFQSVIPLRNLLWTPG
jgi:type IV pilus assembly protein PilW